MKGEGKILDEMPLVSIITPSYNQGPFIEDTILSIKNQDYPNIEHIIVDGESTDNTLEIVKKYEGTYNMKWISEPDEGQADAINKGFRRATGDIICWLNSDDVYLSKNALSKIVALFQEYPKADVITGGGVLMSREGHWTQPIHSEKKRICYKHLRYGDSILQPATFFKREVIEGEWCDTSLDFAFDWDLFIRLTKNYNFLPVDEIIAGYRMYGENKTAAGGAKRAAELVRVVKRYLGRGSWQYFVVSFFWLLYKVTSVLPDSIGAPLQKLIKRVSAIVSILTFKRVTSV